MKKIIPYIMAAAIGFGAAALAFHDREYHVKEAEGIHYLCKKSANLCEPISNDFQLGSLEYRLEGVEREIKLVRAENDRFGK